MTLQIDVTGRISAAWEPDSRPDKEPGPAWRYPQNTPPLHFPHEPVQPAIQPTEPWEDPEPKREPPNK